MNMATAALRKLAVYSKQMAHKLGYKDKVVIVILKRKCKNH